MSDGFDFSAVCSFRCDAQRCTRRKVWTTFYVSQFYSSKTIHDKVYSLETTWGELRVKKKRKQRDEIS